MKRICSLLGVALLTCLLPLGLIAQQTVAPPPKPLAHTYRLTYTLTILDGGKRTGVQHYSMTISAPSNRGSLKIGEKVPVVTGSYSGDSKGGVQTQFTYLDLGLNIDATLIEDPNGIQLVSKIEQSSVLPAPAKIAEVNEPVIRQTVLSNTSVVSVGKSVVLGSFDMPETTRHGDIEVTVEQIT
jgi:hypothetical protein